VEFALDLAVEALGVAVRGDEAEELLEPRQGLLAVAVPPQVEAEAAVRPGDSPVRCVQVVEE
jgi:hypothetical protein